MCGGALDAITFKSTTQASTRALLVGMMHGMVRSAAIVLLSLGAMDSTVTRFGYIAVFGVGSIFGMALLSTAIAVPLRWSARLPASTRALISSAIGATAPVVCAI
jgi:hypothetical protein